MTFEIHYHRQIVSFNHLSGERIVLFVENTFDC